MKELFASKINQMKYIFITFWGSAKHKMLLADMKR